MRTVPKVTVFLIFIAVAGLYTMPSGVAGPFSLPVPFSSPSFSAVVGGGTGGGTREGGGGVEVSGGEGGESEDFDSEEVESTEVESKEVESKDVSHSQVSTSKPSALSTSAESTIVATATARLSSFQPLRGVRYLYEHLHLLLYVPPFLPGDPVVIRHAGSITPGVSGERPSPDCGEGGEIDLSIYVRLLGPEIITGIAVPHPTDACTWLFEYSDQYAVPSASGTETETLPTLTPGSYNVTVKAYGLSDSADLSISQCNFTSNSVLTGTVLSEYQPFGSFYGEGRSCCEMCTRKPDCAGWTFTGYKGIATKCIFYSTITGERIATEGSEGWPKGAGTPTAEDPNYSKYVSGTSRPKNLPVSYYLGCGYAAGLEDAVCLEEGTDDEPLMAAETVVVRTGAAGGNVGGSGGEGEVPREINLPRCGSGESEARASHGRWVRSDSEELGCPAVDSPRTPQTK